MSKHLTLEQRLLLIESMSKGAQQRGKASLRIELENGTITMKHGLTGKVLAVKKRAREGQWWAMFQAIVKSIDMEEVIQNDPRKEDGDGLS